MRVGILSYPMLFQRTGGLQIQINETIHALRSAGVNAGVVNAHAELLSDFDVIHVFSAINGNHRLVETAKSLGCKVVLSPLIRPSWTRWTGRRGAFLERLVGKCSGWQLQTSYAQIRSALTQADHIVALGDIEKTSIETAFRIPGARISVIPNGVTQRFFDASPDEFFQRWGWKDKFVLNVAAINPHKNQLAIIKALQGHDYPIVLIGECVSEHLPYLARLTSCPNVEYLGPLPFDATSLCLAYAAATVFALPSDDEVMPLCVMESLAAGTPVVMTDRHAMRLDGAADAVKEHPPADIVQMRSLLLASLATPALPAACQRLVENLRWTHVAQRLIAIYEEILMRDARATS